MGMGLQYPLVLLVPPLHVACGGPPPCGLCWWYVSIFLSIYLSFYVCMYVSKYVCMYVRMYDPLVLLVPPHTYIHTLHYITLHTYIHTIHTYHTYIHPSIHPCIHTYIHHHTSTGGIIPPHPMGGWEHGTRNHIYIYGLFTGI